MSDDLTDLATRAQEVLQLKARVFDLRELIAHAQQEIAQHYKRLAELTNRPESLPKPPETA